MPKVQGPFFCHHVRTWTGDDFRLDLWDTHRVSQDGKYIVAFQLHHGDDLIFDGSDYAVSPLHAIDSDASVAGLLGFLSLRPGDTDPEYFASYTSRQIEWAISHGEELAVAAEDLEESR